MNTRFGFAVVVLASVFPRTGLHLLQAANRA